MKRILYTFFILGSLLFLNNSVQAQIDCSSNDACAYELTAADSFGDGWNGASITITTSTSVTNYGGPAAAGPDIIPFTVVDGETVTITENGAGTFPGEISYSISGPTGDTPVDVTLGNYSGTNTFSFTAVCPSIPAASCELPLDIDLTDSFGDGWNGGSMDITYIVDGGAPITTNITLANPPGADENQIYANVPILEGTTSTIEVEYTFNAGGFVGEVGWTFNDPTTVSDGGMALKVDAQNKLLLLLQQVLHQLLLLQQLRQLLEQCFLSTTLQMLIH